MFIWIYYCLKCSTTLYSINLNMLKKEQKIVDELFLDQLSPKKRQEIEKLKDNLDKCTKK